MQALLAYGPALSSYNPRDVGLAMEVAATAAAAGQPGVQEQVLRHVCAATPCRPRRPRRPRRPPPPTPSSGLSRQLTPLPPRVHLRAGCGCSPRTATRPLRSAGCSRPGQHRREA